MESFNSKDEILVVTEQSNRTSFQPM